MGQIIERIKNRWRTLVTAVFVLLVFTVPASKSIIGKFFSAAATGGNQHGNNNGNNHGNSHGNSHSHSNSHSNSGSSHSSPNSGPSASPMHPGNSCSSGRHSRSGHSRRRNNRPNGH